MRPALLVIGHGTRSAPGVAQFGDLVEHVAKAAPAADVEGGFLELAPPPIQDAVARLVAAGHDRVDVVPLVLVAAGHSKGDMPAALERERLRHPGLSFRYGRPLGPHPLLLAELADRLSEVVPPEGWGDIAVVLVGRGATDPDANAEVAKTARLLLEGRGIGTVETAFVSLAAPSVTGGLDRAARLGYRRVVVLPFFLFAGVLPDRIVTQAAGWAAEHPDVEVLQAGLIGPADRLVQLVLERWREIAGGDLRMNCDTCAYRTVLPGFEAKVGAPQTPHDHPDDPAHPHGHKAHGHEAHGHEAHGHEAHGPEAHGPEAHGPEAHGHEAHGPEAHSHEAHSHEAHGHEAHGHEAHGHEAHGHGAHDHLEHPAS